MYYLQSRYYDPEMGRFISSDDAAMSMSALEDITSANLFAYCGNDPVNRVDPNGYDAVWLQDTNAVGGAGHTGLLISISNGWWWYFYWGLYLKYRKIKFKFTSLSALNNKLNTTTDIIDNRSVPIYTGKFEKYIYFSGNFKQTHNAILKIFTSREKLSARLYYRGFNYLYNLLYANCMQMSTLYLSYGVLSWNTTLYRTLIHIWTLYIIPNSAYKYLVKKLK